METIKFDLFYCENSWPWHYDRPGERFKKPIGEHWHLIAENEENEKLTLFTDYYTWLKIDFDKDKRPFSKIVSLWNEFEIFYKAVENKKAGICRLNAM